MRRISLSVLLHLSCVALFGQSKNSVELSVVGRYDQHANYVSNFAGRVYNDTNRLSGFSYGINGIFNRKIASSLSLYFGLGYYQMRIDKVRGNLPFNIPGTRTARNINYSDGTDILYSTPKYHYNDVTVTLGIDKTFRLGKSFGFDVAPEIVGYQTFSQKYQIGSGSRYYTTHNNKPLELGVNIKTGIYKEFKSFYLHPSLLIPVYQNLKGDKVFYEDRQMNISKWFHGIGVSIAIGKYF